MLVNLHSPQRRKQNTLRQKLFLEVDPNSSMLAVRLLVPLHTMSSFLVLRASSSRRTLAALPSLDHASNPGRPLRRTRTVNQSALLVREALVSRRQFSSSLPTREDSMYDKRMKEYQDSARYTTAEKKRRQELVAVRAGQAYPLLSELTVAVGSRMPAPRSQLRIVS